MFTFSRVSSYFSRAHTDPRVPRFYTLHATVSAKDGLISGDPRGHPVVFVKICKLPPCAQKDCGDDPCAEIIGEKKIGNLTHKDPARMDGSSLENKSTGTFVVVESEARSKDFPPGTFSSDVIHGNIVRSQKENIEQIISSP